MDNRCISNPCRKLADINIYKYALFYDSLSLMKEVNGCAWIGTETIYTQFRPTLRNGKFLYSNGNDICHFISIYIFFVGRLHIDDE